MKSVCFDAVCELTAGSPVCASEDKVACVKRRITSSAT